MSRSPFAAGCAAAFLALAAAANAQAPVEGYESQVVTLPGNANSVTAVDGGVVWFDGQTLFVDEAGQPSRALLTLPSFRFGSFTLSIGNGNLLFAESSLGEVWRVPLDPNGTPQLLAVIPFAYDAVAIGTGVAIVSAKLGGFSSAQNDLIALDLVTGAQSPVGVAPGASGPLTLGRSGDLFYATAPLTFPPPPQSVEILRWNAAQWSLALNQGLLLTRTNAQLVAAGLDAASDLAVDDDGELILVDYWNAAVLEQSANGGGRGALVDYSAASLSPAAIAFLPGSAGAQFEPFARGQAGVLCVVETDYFSATQVRMLRPAPASLGVAAAGTGPVPPGPFALQLQDGARGGLCLIAVGTVGTGVLLPLQLPGFEQTVAWEAGLLFPVTTGLAPLDVQGVGGMPLQNPGFPGGLWIHAQALFVDAAGAVIGGSNVLSVALN